MTRLTLSFFGTFQAVLDGRTLTNFRSSNVQGMFIYLVMHGDRPINRDVLATLFWPDEPDNVARTNFRSSLYQLRKTLKENKSERPFLLVTRQTVQFNTAADYSLDVTQFSAAVAGGQLEQAANLYTSDLLPGFTCDSLVFEEWLRVERERWHQLGLEMLDALTEQHLNQEAYSAAQESARRQLALEPWLESAYRQLMQALALDGDRNGALSEYESCQRILAEELGVEPTAETAALAEHIRQGEIGGDDPNFIGDRFALGEEIGRGAMGVVLRGRDVHTGRSVAIKTVNGAALAVRPKLVERFRREGEILRQLNHPNIVDYLAMVEREGQYYLVMEYADGGDLRQLLERGHTLPLEQVLTIALDIADALTRTHRLNILHRDLKPSNILLDEHGVPKLSDFGLAQFSNDVELTQQGMVVGTVAYLSPEACQAEPLDQRADIWSFGVLLFELLTGRRPFEGSVASAMILAIMNHPVPDIALLRADVPADLRDLLFGMLQKDSAERISSVRYVGGVLETILQAMQKGALSRRFPITQPIEMGEPQQKDVGYAPTVLNLRAASTVGPLDALAVKTPFVGRVVELGRIIQTLNKPTCRLLTIVGAGGVGKTRLAVQVARAYIEQTGYEAHFTSLVGFSTTRQVVQSLYHALRVTADVADSQLDAVERLVTGMTGRPMLLVLDSAESWITNEAHEFLGLINLLTAQLPDLHLLVTSHQPLKAQQEWVYYLRGLSVPAQETVSPEVALQYDGVALFVQQAQKADVGFGLTAGNVADVIALCQQLEGVPLAVELAAAQMRHRPLAELRSRLVDSYSDLRVDQPDMSPRHRSLEAVFEQSWNLLNQHEQVTLSQAAVFQGGFGRAAAFAVLGEQTRLLERLVEKSLLERRYTPDGVAGVRYVMPQMLRRHLAIAHPVEWEVYQRHATYYLQWGVTHQTQAVEEEENLRAAWRWAEIQPDFRPPRGWDAAWLEGFDAVPLLEPPQEPTQPVLIGREPEMATMQEVTRPLQHGQGHGGLITIVGDAGIGKSFLVAGLQQETAVVAGKIAWFDCVCDETSAQGLLPFRHWLKRYFRQRVAVSVAENLAAFEVRFADVVQATADESVAAELTRLRSLLAALVELRVPDSLYTKLRPEQRGENFQLALKTLIQAECLLQPVIVHVEDAHWIDAESQTLLTTLAQQTNNWPLVLVVTARPQGFEPLTVPDVAQQVIRLTPFGESEVVDLAAQLLGEEPAADLVTLLLEKGGGNPFYTEQVVLYLRDNGLVKQGRLVSRGSGNSSSLLPSDVHNVLVSRLGGLDEGVQQVVAQAAVLGQEFSVPVLSQVVGAEQLEESLQLGMEAAVWQPLGNGRYLFNHALLREAAVSTQFDERKRELHQQAARAVAKTATAERPQYAELAYHYDEAGDTHRAASNYLKAGDEARENYFIREAHGYYGRGLALAQTEKQRLALLLGREAVNHWLGNREEQKEDLRQLVGLTAGSEDKALLADITLRRATMYLATAEYDQAIQQAQRATALASSLQNRALEAKAYHRWGRAMWQQGKGRAGKPLLTRALRLAQTVNDTAEQAQCLYDLGMLAYFAAQYDEAIERLTQAIEFFERENDQRNIVRCTDILGLVSMAKGDYEQSMVYFRQALAVSKAIDWSFGVIYVLNHWGNCYFELGDYEQCRQLHEQVLPLARTLQDSKVEVMSLDSIGLTYQFQGQLLRAKEIYEEALSVLQELKDPRERAFVQTHLGLTLIGLEEMEQAGILLYDAITLRIETGADEFGIDTEAALAWLDLAQGDTDLAVERVHTILEWLDENGHEGVELPLQVYWQCFMVLQTAGALEQAVAALEIGHDLLQKLAQNIQNVDLRQQYLTAVPYHRQIVAAWQNQHTA